MDDAQSQKLDDLTLQSPEMLRIGDHRICVVRVGEEVFGVNNICPHAGAALHPGHCNAQGVITCPLHGYKFDLRTGRSADGNGYQLRRFPLERREDGWYLGIKKF